MSNVWDFKIENGVLTEYTGHGGDVVIPDGVTSIGDSAFSDCSKLKSITIPDGVTSIGYMAFLYCYSLTSITIPDSVTSIDADAFLNTAYYHEKSNWDEGVLYIGNHLIEAKENAYIIREGTKHIAKGAFNCCTKLKSITIPDSVTSIDAGAFEDCYELETVELKNFSESINYVRAFPKNAKLYAPKAVLKLKQQIPVSRVDVGAFVENAEDYADIVLYQKAAGWADWCVENAQWFEQAIPIMIQALAEEKTVAPAKLKLLLRLVENANGNIDAKILVDFLETIGKYTKGASLKTVQQYIRDLSAPQNGNPIETYVTEMIKTCPISHEIQTAVKDGIPYADGTGKCSENALRLILEEYAKEWKRCAISRAGGMGSVEMLENGEEIKISKIADEIAAALDRTALIARLRSLVHGSKYRLFILAYARYTDEEEAEAFVAEINRNMRGCAKDRYWAQNGVQALYLSESKAAMKLLDKMGMLYGCAKVHGLSAVELRNTVMLPDLGLNDKGTKLYILGQACYEARVMPDLSVVLFDTDKQKVIHSIPQKNGDPEQAEAIREDFNALKKKVKQFIKESSEMLCRMHVTGESLSQQAWKQIYLGNPVLGKIAESVIWADTNNRTFALVEGKMVTANQETFEPDGSIHVAHVLEMSETEISQWQQFLLQMKRSELFEQVWEPVLDGRIGEIQTRYEGLTLTTSERNSVKNHLKQRGISVHSDEMEKEYDRSGRYTFASENTMHFGNTLSLNYYIDSDAKTITVKKACLKSQNQKELNAILFELDRAAIGHYIETNQSEFLREELLNLFSVAQISEFIELAISHKATECTAMLMDYKNSHFQEYDAMDSFVLSW